jgi:phage protein D
MTVVLCGLLIASAALIAILVWMHLSAKTALKRYSQLGDIESYKASCEVKASAALIEAKDLAAKSSELNQQLIAQKNQAIQYQKLLGKFHSAAELHEKVEQDKARVQKLAATIGRLEHAVDLNTYIQTQNSAIQEKTAELDSLSSAIGSARTVGEIAAQVTYYQNLLAQLKTDLEAVEEAKTLQEFGFYRSRYNFNSSEGYQDRLESIRDKQKVMLSMKAACTCSTEWTVDGSKSEGRRMTDKQIRLMLRAFNGECDAAVGKVRYNNVVSLENRIRKSFEQINKLGESGRVSISSEFCDLKFEELRLSHEYQEKKEDEREEQRLVREQMREEQKVQQEVDKTLKTAKREERLKKEALDKAREELAHTTGRETEKLAALVARLENELHEALDRKAKAIARAQLTKSGHVYILSNIGAFGDEVYKIGMSRRLEPLERVNELGGAAVPFPFDVHAMIYSENAPELECALHRHFANRRVNLVNLRREFFRVSLDEIRAAVAEHFGQVTFLLTPEAAQYRQTTAMLKDALREQPQLQIA